MRAPPLSAFLMISRETKGRKGKALTYIEKIIPLEPLKQKKTRSSYNALHMLLSFSTISEGDSGKQENKANSNSPVVLLLIILLYIYM